MSHHRKHQVAKVKMVPSEMVVVNLETIKNLKEWSIISYILTLIGGILAGGIFLFSQSQIDLLLATSVIIGFIMIFLGILIEWRKFSCFTKRIVESVDIGSLYYSGDTVATERDYESTETKTLSHRRYMYEKKN